MKTDKTNVVYVSNGWVKQFFDSQKEANNLLVPHWADLHNYSKNTVRKSYTNKLAKSKRKCQKCDPFFLKHFNSSCFKWSSNEISYSERVMSAIPLFSACVCSSFVLDESPPFYPPPQSPRCVSLTCLWLSGLCKLAVGVGGGCSDPGIVRIFPGHRQWGRTLKHDGLTGDEETPQPGE